MSFHLYDMEDGNEVRLLEVNFPFIINWVDDVIDEGEEHGAIEVDVFDLLRLGCLSNAVLKLHGILFVLNGHPLPDFQVPV